MSSAEVIGALHRTGFRLEALDPATGLGGAAEGIVPAGGSTFRTNLILEAAGTLSGRVLTFDGRPAAGAAIILRTFRGERSAPARRKSPGCLPIQIKAWPDAVCKA